jgi:hypothetical protein
MTSSNFYPLLIIRARPQHTQKAPGFPPSSLFNFYVPEHHCHGKPIAITMNHSEDYPSDHSPPTATFPGKLLRYPRNLVTVEYFSPPILFITGIHFPPVLLHNQSYPKVCPDPLNLPNASDSFAGISLLFSCSLFFPTRDLIALI